MDLHRRHHFFLTRMRSQPTLVMRYLLAAVVACSFQGIAFSQCPVQPHHASIDLKRKRLAIHYYNSDKRTVQAVEFTLRRSQQGKNDSTVVSYYSTRETLQPKTDKTAVFHRPVGKSDDISEAAQAEELEVQVTRVVFTDRSTWKPGRENTCKISFSPR